MHTQPLPPVALIRDETQLEELAELATLPAMLRLTALCFVATGLGWGLQSLGGMSPLSWGVYATAFVSGGWYTVQEAWASLRQREFDVNFLMIIAALGAAAVGQPREGAILMFLFALSNSLEIYAMGRTHDAVTALLAMAPDQANLLDGESTRTVSISALRVSDIVRVRPGERIPIDGVVCAGLSAVNEAAITGEAMPADKRVGSHVFAGTLNTLGSLDIKVSVPAGDTALARIVQTVIEARTQKAQAQDFTDRIIGQYYAYGVVAMTLLAIAIPLLFLDWSFQTTLYRAMALMVVASPCALVISVPAAVLSAMASGARRGVLFKGGRHLEAAASIKVVALDKTGTITTGTPRVATIQPRGGCSADEILAAAAAVEARSEHPLAQAIMREAMERGLTVAPTGDFAAIAGIGAEATVAGQRVRVGRPAIFATDGDDAVTRLEQQGFTVIAVGAAEIWGLIGLEDTLRPAARAAIERLKQTGIDHIVLLTGDNQAVADRLAAQLGIDQAHAGLLPADKARIIRELQASRGPVAMVGDGINDAPALATARLGVAMGVAGTDVALQSADVLLMSDDLLNVAEAIALGRRTRRVVLQNIAFALAVIVSLVASALAGGITLPLGVVGHEGSTLLVVINGLRLLRNPQPPRGRS